MELIKRSALIAFILAGVLLFARPAVPVHAEIQSFYSIERVDVTPDSASDWYDVDCSSYIPSGATGVILHVVNDTLPAADYDLGLRKNGSSDNRHTVLYRQTQTWAAIGVDSNRVFEAYVGSTSYIEIYLVGYTKSGVIFFDNAYDVSLEDTGGWYDIDCSTECPDAIGLIFEVENVGVSGVLGNIRMNGSSDARITTYIRGHTRFTQIMGCDGSQVVEGYINNTDLNYYLTGYITDGCTFSTNATDISYSYPAGQYQCLQPVQYHGVGSVDFGTGAIQPGLPSSLAVNEVCIMVASTDYGETISITNQGSITWTAVSGTPVAVSGGETLYVWWGRYASGSTAPTLTPSGDHAIARIAGYRNVITTGIPVNVYETGSEASSDTSFSFTTTETSDLTELLLCVCTTGRDTETTSEFDTMTNASLSTINERFDNLTRSGGGGGFAMDDGYLPATGTMGTWATTLGNASPKAYISLGLQPQSVVPASTAMAFIECDHQPWFMTIRTYGESVDYYDADADGCQAMVAPDETYGYIESKIEGADLDLYLVGYAIAVEGEPEGEVDPTLIDFGVNDVSTTMNTAINYFTVTNIGTGTIDIDISGTDATGGDDTWTLSNTGSAGIGENIFALYAGLDDDDDNFDIIIKKSAPYNELVGGLVEDASQDFGIKVYMPTSVTNYEGQVMTSTVTLIVSAS